jgi:hypothetical protein
MLYYYDDGVNEECIQLIVSHVDPDGYTIFERLDADGIVISAQEYIETVYAEMQTAGEEIQECAERVREVFKREYSGEDVVFETPTDEQIKKYLLDDFNMYAEENEREEMTIDDVRSAL